MFTKFINLFIAPKKSSVSKRNRHAEEIKKYTKDAIKTYNKTLRKLSYE